VSRMVRRQYQDGPLQVAVLGGELGAAEARWSGPDDFHCVVHSPVDRGRPWTRHNPLRRCKVIEGDCWQVLAGLPASPGEDLWPFLERMYEAYLRRDLTR